MIRSNLCDYGDSYIPVSAITIITGEGDDHNGKQLDERNKRVIFKNCALFTGCIQW